MLNININFNKVSLCNKCNRQIG